MALQRRRTARELLTAAGRLSCATTAAAALALAPSAAWAQPAATQPAVRDPMKPARGGADDQTKVKVSEHNTVDLHVKDEELANVLELLSIQTQQNIIASKNVSGKVSATLYGVTFDEALSSILHVNGFTYMRNGNFIYVYTQDEYKQIEAALKKRVAKVIKLNYLNAADAKEFVSPLLSKDGGEIKVNDKTKDFTINDKAPAGKDDYALGATLVVIDFEENIKAIEELIKQIDTRPQQVLVEATILQTALNEANAFGVDFSIIGDLDFSDFISIGGPLGAANGLIRGGNGSSGQGLSPSDNQGTAITSNPGNTSGPGTMKVGIVADDISIFLRLLDQVTDTTILSNPKILALNRQPARVLVGKRVGYLNTTSTETSTTQSVEFLDTGTQLYFRPFVSSEGEIRMELKPQVSAAEIRTVTDANGAAVTIPDEVTQELTTNVNVKDGQTIVLGGLFTESTSFTRRQVPWLGDLPIIGAAFRGNEDATQRSEIIFLITPTIVTDTMIVDSAERAGANMERLRAGNRQGLLPWSRERMTGSLNVEAEKLARDGKYDEALHKIQRSLSLNANQPDAYRLRERISGERERWNSPSQLDEIYHTETSERLGSIPVADPKPAFQKPYMHRDTVREPIKPTPGAPAGVRGTEMYTPTTATADATSNGSLDAALDAAVNNSTTGNSTGTATTSSGEFTSADASLQPTGEPGALNTSNDPNFAAPTTTESLANNTAASNESSPTNSVSGTNTYNVEMNQKAAVKSVQLTLPNLRGQIELYGLMNDKKLPPLGTGSGDGWQSFVDSNMIKESPRNDYVGGTNATRVVLGSKPDTNFHSNYGWIFNPETGELWAAGFDVAGKPLPRTTAGVTTPANTNPAVENNTNTTQPQQADATPAEPLSSNTGSKALTPEEFESSVWATWFGVTPEFATSTPSSSAQVETTK